MFYPSQFPRSTACLGTLLLFFSLLASPASAATPKQRSFLQQKEAVLNLLLPLDQPETLAKAVSAAESYLALTQAVEPVTLLRVDINPEARVKIKVVTVPAAMGEGESHRFLLEIHNHAQIKAVLRLQTMNMAAEPPASADWCQLQLVTDQTSNPQLTGEEREWKVLELRSTQVGQTEIRILADAGQGTQDLGFRATADLLLKTIPATIPNQK